MVPPIKRTEIFEIEHHNIPFLSLKDYEKEAKKYILKFATKALAHSIMKDEESISFIVEKLIRADWRYRVEIGVRREDYRVQCAKWSITDLVKRWHTEQKKKEIPAPLQTDFADDDYEFIERVFSCESLVETERDVLRQRFFENKSIAKIAQSHNCGPDKIRKILRDSLQKIREWFPCGV